jgi:hypothetical protein
VAIVTPGVPLSTIYYTIDGTIPTHASAIYTGPILLGDELTLHAIAFEPCVCTDSNSAFAQFSFPLDCVDPED